MTFEPEEEPVRSDSPAGDEPAGEPGVSAAEAPAPDGPRPRRSTRARLGFREWRRGRPFWGGLLVLLGGGEIIFTYHAPMALSMHFGLYGLAGYLVPGMLVLLGLLILFDPVHRTFYSVLAVLAALGTWLTSNLGGFILGMILGLVGGSMAFGWQVGPHPTRAERKRRRRYRPAARTQPGPPAGA